METVKAGVKCRRCKVTLFNPKFTITHRMTAAITQIERARGFIEAARLSDDWVRDMGNQALMKEAHHTTHIEGTQLTLEQAERLWKGEDVPGADPDGTRELLNYRSAFEFVSDCLDPGDPVTEGLIREIHKKLVEGVRGGKADPAVFTGPDMISNACSLSVSIMTVTDRLFIKNSKRS